MTHNTYLGVELGSTRMKAVVIDGSYAPVASGDFTWKSDFVNGVWTYDLSQVLPGLKTAIGALPQDLRKGLKHAGVSGMMHGYLAFDKDWNLLTPFRTWQNTITAPAAAELTALFGFNVPQRWSVAHLYQAVLNGEDHLPRLAHITTLAGYIHYLLTGENVLGVDEASGVFPIDEATCDYDAGMLEKLEKLLENQPFSARDVLPKVLPAGADAGRLTASGAALLDGLLPVGLPFCPPEGDAGTGMVATNAVAPRTGNVSAGTSIFAMLVLEKALSRVYEEIDMVMTPGGRPVAMVHANNGTNDMNAWVSLLGETAKLFGADPSTGELYTKLYELALAGDADCGGVLVYNYMAGEGITHLDQGRPMVLRSPESRLTLANFLRAQLYGTMATMRLGMDLIADEHVALDRLNGHGGLFKTPVVGQRLMAAACKTPVTCMETAGEGGPYGMALLAAYAAEKDGKLEEFLDKKVFANAQSTTIAPDPADVAGFDAYLARYEKALAAERAAVETL